MSAILAAVTILILSGLGVLLTLATLPGVWLVLASAVLIDLLWRPGTFSPWTLGVCGGIALAGEIIELVSGSVGAKRFGGSTRGGWGALGGSLVGALAGSFVLPIIGTVAGAVLGAGLGAAVLERSGGADWKRSSTAGAGAAAGRAVAILVKVAAAALVGVILSVAAFVR